jgi:hypothetical protein
MSQMKLGLPVLKQIWSGGQSCVSGLHVLRQIDDHPLVRDVAHLLRIRAARRVDRPLAHVDAHAVVLDVEEPAHQALLAVVDPR